VPSIINRSGAQTNCTFGVLQFIQLALPGANPHLDLSGSLEPPIPLNAAGVHSGLLGPQPIVQRKQFLPP
jgi:hypothetical protein